MQYIAFYLKSKIISSPILKGSAVAENWAPAPWLDEDKLLGSNGMFQVDGKSR